MATKTEQQIKRSDVQTETAPYRNARWDAQESGLAYFAHGTYSDSTIYQTESGEPVLNVDGSRLTWGDLTKEVRANVPTKKATKTRTAEDLWAAGYRIGAEAEGFRVYRGEGGSYYVNCLRNTCECTGFRNWRYCCHLTELRGLCLLQLEETLAVRRRAVEEQGRIVAQIRRGGLTCQDAECLRIEAQELNDLDWKYLQEMAALRSQMFRMGIVAGVEAAERLVAA